MFIHSRYAVRVQSTWVGPAGVASSPSALGIALFALVACAGCGRVNLKLLPRPDLDGGIEPDDPEAEAEDSGTASDDQAQSLLDADGLQTTSDASADGACLTGCEVTSLCAIEHADDSCGVGYCRETNTP